MTTQPRLTVGSGKTAMRVELKGIASATKKLADGPRVTYYYAWRGGPRLVGEPGTPDFIASYNAAVATRRLAPSGRLNKLIDTYLDSTEFLNLTDRSKKEYRRHIARIREKFGSMPLAAVEDPRARGTFKTWRDEIAAKTPREADYAWMVLARILSVAKDRGNISVNQCERGGHVYYSDRADIIWTAPDIEQFCRFASPVLQFVLLLALWTGQRLGDLLALPWSAYDGAYIRIQQSKGKRKGKAGPRVTIPVSKVLKAALDKAKQSACTTTILCTSRGTPWTKDGFQTSWGKAYKRSGVAPGLHFHDFRGTAVTRLALAGCTVPQIAAITGHSLNDVQDILDAHYLGGRIQLAEQAIEKLDAAYGS
jgi:integrase